MRCFQLFKSREGGDVTSPKNDLNTLNHLVFLDFSAFFGICRASHLRRCGLYGHGRQNSENEFGVLVETGLS